MDHHVKEDGELGRIDAALRDASITSPFDDAMGERPDERISVPLREFVKESLAFRRALGLTHGFELENDCNPDGKTPRASRLAGT